MPECCCCQAVFDAKPLEKHRDSFSGQVYSVFKCPCCAAAFSEPRRVAADWYEKAVPEEPSEPAEKDGRFLRFLEDVPAAGRLLDVGCGEGGFLFLARRRGFADCLGFDWDQRRAAAARLRGLDVRASDWESFCRGRAEEEFDAVTLFDVLEHMAEPAAVLREIRRLLKDGGHLAVTVPNALRPLPFGREDYDFPPHHFTRWTPAALRGLLERQGFSVLRVETGRAQAGYLLGVMTSHWAVKPAIAAAKALLFRGKSQAGATLTQLFDAQTEDPSPRGLLARKSFRALLYRGYEACAKAAFAPLAWGLALALSLRKDSGHCLYVLARKSRR